MARPHSSTKRPTHKGISKRRGAFLVETRAKGWQLRWTCPLSGKRKQQSLAPLGITSAKARQEAAEKKSAEIQAQKRQLAGVDDARDEKPSNVVEMHLATLSPASRSSRQSGLRRLAQLLEESGVDSTLKVDRAAMTSARDVFAADERVRPATRQLWISISATFWRWARDRSYVLVSRDDIDDAHKGVKVPTEMPVVLQPDAVRQMLDVAFYADVSKPQFRMCSPFLVGLILAGCRPHELYLAEWSDVQLDAERLLIRGAGRKTSRARSVTFEQSPAFVSLLKAVRKRRPPSVEKHPFGFSRTSVQRITERMRSVQCDEQGNPLVLPDGFEMRAIRRTTASILATAPWAGPVVAAQRGGHDIRTIQAHYLGHVRNLKKGAATIEGALGIEGQVERVVEHLEGK